MMNITLGQFYPGDSLLHRMDPRTKILLTVAMIVTVFLVRGFLGYVALFLYIAAAARAAKVSLKVLAKGIKPILFIILLTFFLNVFFAAGEDVIFAWKFITVSWTGVKMAIYMALRLILLVLGTQLLTLTTSPIALTDGLERLFRPMSRIGFPAHELAMMMSIALRFIPTLIEETDKIMSAQKARGADFESGSIIDRAKALVPILVPLFISAFRRADELAVAMECRCYHGGHGRTKLHVLHYQTRDYLVLSVYAVILAAVIVLARFGL